MVQRGAITLFQGPCGYWLGLRAGKGCNKCLETIGNLVEHMAHDSVRSTVFLCKSLGGQVDMAEQVLHEGIWKCKQEFAGGGSYWATKVVRRSVKNSLDTMQQNVQSDQTSVMKIFSQWWRLSFKWRSYSLKVLSTVVGTKSKINLAFYLTCRDKKRWAMLDMHDMKKNIRKTAKWAHVVQFSIPQGKRQKSLDDARNSRRNIRGKNVVDLMIQVTFMQEGKNMDSVPQSIQNGHFGLVGSQQS